MDESVYCPYCGPWNGHPNGVEMCEVGDWFAEQFGFPEQFWYCCPVCATETPWAYTREEANAIARRRFQPMQKPLTLEEVKEIALRVFKGEFSKHIVFVEGFLPGTNASREFGYAEPYKRCDLDLGDPQLNAIKMYYPGSTESEDYDEKLYGIYWRCWQTRPTKEERAAAEWRDKE